MASPSAVAQPRCRLRLVRASQHLLHVLWCSCSGRCQKRDTRRGFFFAGSRRAQRHATFALLAVCAQRRVTKAVAEHDELWRQHDGAMSDRGGGDDMRTSIWWRHAPPTVTL